jgi:hypothetical protein
MSKKNKKKPQTISAVTPPPWWRRAWAKITLIPLLSSIVGIVALGYNYKTSDADELRTLIYQPLYADLVKVENSLRAVSIDGLPPDKVLRELRQTGAIERVPGTLKNRLVKVFEESTEAHMAALAVKEIVIREMSARIMEIRTEESDRAWHQKTGVLLREMSMAKPKKGISDLFTLAEGVTHESVGQSMDVRDPSNPVIGGPGGPIFVVRDWLGYPEIITTIDALWKETDFLYFNQTRYDWYYRLTREDLKRIDTSLEQYLKPVFNVLKENADFKRLRTERPILLSEIAAIKDALTDRIQDPKQIRDLIDL